MTKTASTWQVYRTRFLIRARRLSRPLVFVDALGREHQGKKGDYLVESSDGLRSITPRKIFEDIYVTLGGFRPTAAFKRAAPHSGKTASVSPLPQFNASKSNGAKFNGTKRKASASCGKSAAPQGISAANCLRYNM